MNGATLRGDARLANYFLWASESDLLELYTREFRAELAESTAVGPLLDFLRPLDERVSALDRMLALEQRFFMADHNFTYTDKMSMAVGVEVRVRSSTSIWLSMQREFQPGSSNTGIQVNGC